MLQETQCRRWYCVLQMKDVLDIWAFPTPLGFVSLPYATERVAQPASALEVLWWWCCCRWSLHMQMGKGSWWIFHDQRDEQKQGRGCSLHSREADTHTCPGDACNISKCVSGLFPPVPILSPDSRSQCSAEMTMTLWSPRHSGFSCGLSENASCFSPLLFPGLDLQRERWDVFPAHPLCLGSALFQCTACSTKTHYQTSPSTVAWLCRCSRCTATANIQKSLSGL